MRAANAAAEHNQNQQLARQQFEQQQAMFNQNMANEQQKLLYEKQQAQLIHNQLEKQRIELIQSKQEFADYRAGFHNTFNTSPAPNGQAPSHPFDPTPTHPNPNPNNPPNNPHPSSHTSFPGATPF